jgi:hypothetical protein
MHGFNEFDRLSLLSDPGTSSPPLLGERLTFRVRQENKQEDEVAMQQTQSAKRILNHEDQIL